MEYEWDEAKRQSNLSKHGFDFRDTEELFAGPVMATLDDRHDYGEKRWLVTGYLKSRLVSAVVIELEDDRRRVISLRKASHHEQEQFENLLRDRLDAGGRDDG